MKVSLWQRRIHRAQELSHQHPFASEILGFYIHLARFQEDLYQRLSGAPPQKDHAVSISAELRPDELQNLSSRFESFLSVAESHGPKFSLKIRQGKNKLEVTADSVDEVLPVIRELIDGGS